MAGNSENKHLGHFIYENFSKKPDFVVQIDAATHKSETASSVLQRSTIIARCLRTLGLKPGDVLALGGRNHLDLRIPFFAAIFNGLPVAAVDPLFKYDEIRSFLAISRPKIAFIQEENLEDMTRAAASLDLEMRIVTFEDGEHSMRQFIDDYDEGSAEEFELAELDSEGAPAFLVSTSGTSGLPKLATLDHGNCIRCLKLFMSFFTVLLKSPPEHGFRNLNLSPVQWISGCLYSFIMPMLGVTNVQTSDPGTPEHYVDIINEYKPFFTIMSPGTASSIMTSKKPCDMTCFQYLMLTGSKVFPDLLDEIKSRIGGEVLEGYGQTETLGMVFRAAPEGPRGNCGKHVPVINQVKLVDPDTLEEITEPHTPGELYVKGNRFSGYYNMPEETKEAFSEDGFFKTGDILYRDENNYYFFVERAKMLIKYNNYSIQPTELEAVILRHPGVREAAVSGAPSRAAGELPVACVVRRAGCDVTEREIEELVADNLSEMKRLRGGVIFMDSLPYTSTGKIARGKLKEITRTRGTTTG